MFGGGFSQRGPRKRWTRDAHFNNYYVLPACYLPDLALTTHPLLEDIHPTTQIPSLANHSILLRTYSVARST
jgi:hypothetical protein